jgi:hypothetical protein
VLDKLERSEIILIIAVSFFALTGVMGLALDGRVAPDLVLDPVTMVAVGPTVIDGPMNAVAWFEAVRQHCNPVEVETYMSWQPAPPNPDGDMYKAACYALAGRIAQARDVIESLPQRQRWEAAGVVFEAGHPAADAGDDVAAGPLMELVVEFWPNHYMALYHAGAARFDTGDHSVAEGLLKRFLTEYQADDGWTRDARSMLERMR